MQGLCKMCFSEKRYSFGKIALRIVQHELSLKTDVTWEYNKAYGFHKFLFPSEYFVSVKFSKAFQGVNEAVSPIVSHRQLFCLNLKISSNF